MSLSPLYTTQTSDLHVSSVQDPPPEFPPASINSCIVHNLSGPSMQALHKAHPGATFAPGVGSGVRCTHLAFTAQTGLGPRLLACIPESSVRVQDGWLARHSQGRDNAKINGRHSFLAGFLPPCLAPVRAMLPGPPCRASPCRGSTSRSVSPSSQRAFHLSLAVLVRYRLATCI